jgi:hypothetical protein
MKVSSSRQTQPRCRYSINLDAAVDQTMREMHAEMSRRWNLSNPPSISLFVAAVLRAFATTLKNDPEVVKILRSEIQVRGSARGRSELARAGAIRKDRQSVSAPPPAVS